MGSMKFQLFKPTLKDQSYPIISDIEFDGNGNMDFR